MIQKLDRRALEEGVRSRPKRAKWVRQRMGGAITIERYTHDGSVRAICVPCILCARAIAALDLCVTCFVDENTIFRGKMHDCSVAPKLTSAQLRYFERLNKNEH